MKKTLIVVSIFLGIVSCKNENQKQVGTNENGEKLVVNEQGDTIVLEENSTIDNSEDLIETNQAALVKNEDETYSFRYNLKKGETYPFVLKTDQSQTMKAGGQSLSLSSARTVEFDYFVEDVSNNHFKLKATFKNFSENFSSSTGEKMAYNTNSAKPTDETVAKSWTIYKSIIGESFKMEVDNKGKVLSINGLEGVVSNALGKLKSAFNAEEQNMVKQLLTESLNNQSIKTQFEETLNIFPDKNIKVGEQWSDSQNISEGPVKGTNKVTRTFKEIKNGNAKITVNGVQDVKGTETQQGITMNMTNTASLDGYIDLDLETGWIKKVNIVKKETLNTVYQKGDQKDTESGTSTTTTTVN